MRNLPTIDVPAPVTQRGKPKSVFDTRPIASLHEEIRAIYQADARPWVIGYSGGKDSTCALQLIWYALSELPVEARQKPVYVISSDTLVETPVIVHYIDTTLERINIAAQQQSLPFRAHKVTPPVDRSFWVNLIGKGYPENCGRRGALPCERNGRHCCCAAM